MLPVTMKTLPLVVFAVALGAASCATSGAVPRPFPTPEAALPTHPAPAALADGYAIASTALALRGSPYRNGGSSPDGFDCSGLIWYVFAQHGITLPRTVGEQFRIGTEVSAGALQSGDLVFFTTTGSDVSHVGMMIGGDEFVHAPTSAGGVRVEHLGSQYWTRRFAGARRVP
jgi:peptidoglycan endopeptidase LytE